MFGYSVATAWCIDVLARALGASAVARLARLLARYSIQETFAQIYALARALRVSATARLAHRAIFNALATL